MFWIVLILAIIIFILIKFNLSLSKDKEDLQSISVEEKFQVISNTLNHEVFQDRAICTPINAKSFYLYEEGKNEIIIFKYSTGNLTIIWKYKYFQKELIHEKQYAGVRNLSLFEQQQIANDILKEMNAQIAKHKIDVISVLQNHDISIIESKEESAVNPGLYTLTDIDGNLYRTVKIGNQLWMAENLNVARFRNGDIILSANTDEEWIKAGEQGFPVWCNINDPNNGKKFGKLYNWFAVNDPRGLAPEGWYIPSDNDWTKLTDFLGGESIAGGKLKATGTWEAGDGLWDDPNKEATNETGFSALPSGSRHNYGDERFFNSSQQFGYWWSSTERGTTAYYRRIYSDNGSVIRNTKHKEVGLSVRCLHYL